MMSGSFLFIIFIIFVALVFDYTNGMHDAANSIATIVSTKVLTPRKAVIWAAFFNFIAFLIFGTDVAKTIGQGLIDISIVNPMVIFTGLLGAIIWNLATWYWGLPSSSSHALMGRVPGRRGGQVRFRRRHCQRLDEDHTLYCPGAPYRHGSRSPAHDRYRLVGA